MQSDSKKRARTVALQVQGIGVPVEVRQHAGARRLTLRVSKTRRAVVVTVPSGCRIEEADRFLKTHVDWVRERLGRVPAPVPLADGATMPLRGTLHRIRFIGPAQGASVVAIESAAHGAPRLVVAGRLEHAARRLKDWLVAEAHNDLDERVSWHAGKLGVRARHITLARSDDPLGLVLGKRAVVVLLAAHPGADLRARLCRRPRGGASARDEPRTPLLEAGGRRRAPPR